MINISTWKNKSGWTDKLCCNKRRQQKTTTHYTQVESKDLCIIQVDACRGGEFSFPGGTMEADFIFVISP